MQYPCAFLHISRLLYRFTIQKSLFISQETKRLSFRGTTLIHLTLRQMHSFFYNGKSRFRLLSFQRKNSEASWEITLLSRTFRQLSENDRLLILLFLVFFYSLLSLYHIFKFCQEFSWIHPTYLHHFQIF